MAKSSRPRPLNATFIHRQTLAGQVRFTTTELGELEAKIANAADRAGWRLEFEIFEPSRAKPVTTASNTIKAGRRGARPRRRCGSAGDARERSSADYVRPEV